jgi:hypothetical protein
MYGFILFQSPEFDLDGLVIEDPVEDLSSNGHAPYVPYDSDKDHKDKTDYKMSLISFK